jgi:hypothetical protein
MEKKKQRLIALVTAIVIAAAVLSGFFLPAFFGKTPRVELPDISSPIWTAAPGGQESPGGSYVKVEVTPETVQNVIATLARPQSYYRELEVETIWGEGEDCRSTTGIEVWSDGGYTKTRAVSPGGLVQNCIVDGDSVYLWYNDDRTWYQTGADKASSDLAQRIPTYEDVLELDIGDILASDYEALGDMYCIYVEAEDKTLGYLKRYWVEVESGLLVLAETVKGGMVVYRMTSNTTEFPIPRDALFTLPDGTVLHQVSQA